EVLDLRGLAQRPHDVEYGVSRLQHVQQHGGLADALHDNRDRSGLGVGVCYGERNALTGVVQPDDDELSGALFLGDTRRLNFEEFYASRDWASCDNREHGDSSTIDSADVRPVSLW